MFFQDSKIICDIYIFINLTIEIYNFSPNLSHAFIKISFNLFRKMIFVFERNPESSKDDEYLYLLIIDDENACHVMHLYHPIWNDIDACDASISSDNG